MKALLIFVILFHQSSLLWWLMLFLYSSTLSPSSNLHFILRAFHIFTFYVFTFHISSCVDVYSVTSLKYTFHLVCIKLMKHYFTERGQVSHLTYFCNFVSKLMSAQTGFQVFKDSVTFFKFTYIRCGAHWTETVQKTLYCLCILACKN